MSFSLNMKLGVFYVFLSAFLLFFTGCGLETVHTLNSPSSSIHTPAYSDGGDYSSHYFEFVTAPKPSDLEITYLGTSIYYMIYSNSSVMVSRNATISSLNTASNYSAAAERIISFGYKKLGALGGYSGDSVIKGYDGQVIRIRLTNYGSSSEFKAVIQKKTGSSYEDIAIPARIGNYLTFDFGRTKYDARNAVPVSGDEDFYSGSFSKKNVYYVDLYAVAEARDMSFSTFYSNVLHLGAVAIDSTLEDN